MTFSILLLYWYPVNCNFFILFGKIELCPTQKDSIRQRRRGNVSKCFGMAMPKLKSTGIASESTPIQRPHLCAFVTFIVSIASMTSKLTLLYIRGDHGSGVPESTPIGFSVFLSNQDPK